MEDGDALHEVIARVLGFPSLVIPSEGCALPTEPKLSNSWSNSPAGTGLEIIITVTKRILYAVVIKEPLATDKL